MNSCPRCKGETTGQNRLVTDSCGHSKCRICLIQDVTHCLECKNEAIPHAQVEYPPTPITVTTLSEHITTNDDGYHCTVCNKSFRSRTQKYYHRGCGNDQLKKYNCPQCSRRFATRSHLNYHLNNHGLRSNFTCNVCDKSFKQKSILQRHIRAHKNEIQRCSQCPQIFRTQAALASHLLFHSGRELRYKCEVCSKHYLTKANLKQHQMKHDQNTPRYTCHICKKSFLRQSTLRLHLERHQKRPCFRCPHCHKSYIHMDALTRHVKQHTSSHRYRCIECDITVNRRDNMLRHIRAMHPEMQFDSGVEIIIATYEESKDKDSLSTDLPAQGVRYSSVIKSVGNVQPVMLPLPEPDTELAMPAPPIALAVTAPVEIPRENVKLYRKIILDLDNEEYSNEPMQEGHLEDEAAAPPSLNTQHKSQQQRISGHGSSNFSEMHWRKNFKFSYENEHIN
ncbi:zinc finger protein 287 [Scaptodrosophila lebanonensis]|uniref:Zinc finger protein 287 n=1 Tax=Drosophila lebanonensis TaxID=7225 RepID=A0A6J2T862_DROLE|nr:zinc finger protein 287 [Scaptodrosophila lebanonensis]